jgi:AcrR family transcriptional regulator
MEVSRKVRGAHQRERVLVAAIPLFASRGYLGTSIEDLLEDGRVGFGNFYELFESKEGCFLFCFERVVGGARTEMAAAAESGSGWADATYLGLHRMIAVMLAAPLEARLALVEAQSAGPEALSRYNALLDLAIGWLQGGREEFVSARGLPAGFERAAVSGLAFYLQQCLLDSRRYEVSKLFAEVAGLVLEPIVGRDELRRLRAAVTSAA